MSNNHEFISTLLWFLYQLWPLMFFAGLQGAIGRRKINLLAILRRMFLIWCGFTLIGGYLLIIGLLETPLFIQEPWNTILFLGSGVLFGGLFFAIGSKDKRRIRRELKQSSSLADLRELSPEDFEKIVVEIFCQAGMKAEQVGESGDHGIDVVIESKTGRHWVAQCKRYKGKVGEPVIRDFYGAMLHEQADRGFVITTGTFTKQAQTWAEGKPIILWDGDKLYALIEELHKVQVKDRKDTMDSEMPSPTVPLCPDCGVPMVKRVASQGNYVGTQFYACPNYPKCSQVKIIENGSETLI